MLRTRRNIKVEKIEANCASEILIPPQQAAGDSIQKDWLLHQYGLGIADSLFHAVFDKVVKEFQKNPVTHLNLKFTLTCEELND